MKNKKNRVNITGKLIYLIVAVLVLMTDSTKVLTKNDVMEGVADMISLIQVEAVFTDGSRLVSIHQPIK